MKSRLLLILCVGLTATMARAEPLPIFDAHIHYSHDAVEYVPPEEVAKILRDAGVKKALVSSSDDDGTQKLKAAAPEIVVPALRPYRRRGLTVKMLRAAVDEARKQGARVVEG